MATTKVQKNTEVAADAAKKTPRKLKGVVISDKMVDTCTVEVNSYKKHPKYQKYLKSRKRYLAHNPGNTKKIGDTAIIEECRPISKRKTFKVIA